MTLTTFKSVGGTSKPTPAKKPAPKAAPKAKAEKPAKAAALKKAKPRAPDGSPDSKGVPGGPYVVISGEGTMPLGADNWRRVPRGTPIPVSTDELAWLENSGVAFKRA